MEWTGRWCTMDVFKQLIADEIERRKNQEKTKFHVDDPDHETKKRLVILPASGKIRSNGAPDSARLKCKFTR